MPTLGADFMPNFQLIALGQKCSPYTMHTLRELFRGPADQNGPGCG